MPSQSKSSKKRMSNAKRKDRRQHCWLRGEERKELRRKLQEKQAKHNRELRAAGKPTPWEVATQERARRMAAGK